MGTPKYKPSNEVAKRVEALAGLGLKNDSIAVIEKISPATLKRYYQGDLDNGREVAIANVSKMAYTMAMSGKVPAMTMFWLKTQAHWREVQRVEHSGPDGKPIETNENIVLETEWREIPKPPEK